MNSFIQAKRDQLERVFDYNQVDIEQFESSLLSVGNEFLPDCAVKVINREELTEDEQLSYLDFLVESVSNS